MRTLIFVNWHSSQHVSRAVVTARTSSSDPLQIIVIDNSCDASEADALRNIGADHLIVSETNLGYGAAVNRAVEAATGEILIIANPDVRFVDDAIDRLVSSVRDGHAVAGPRFVWDDDGRWLLPPAVSPGVAAQLLSSVGTWSAALQRRRSRAKTRARIAFWRSEWPKSVRALSGAVLAVPRTLFNRVGGFDERFHLYFEEIDLLRRIRRGGGVLIHEPRAIVRHLFNQSGKRRADREQVYLESERAYHRKWYGTSAMLRIARPLPAAPPAGAYHERTRVRDATWLEASPEEGFASAAGFHLERPGLPEIPTEILASLGDGHLWIRAVRDDGTELARWVAGGPGFRG